jgi:hypothetical protein
MNILEIWKQKYGEEVASKKWAEKIEKQRTTNKKKMEAMSSEERSKKYGTFGDNNPSKREEVKKLISSQVSKSYIDNPNLITIRSNDLKGNKNPSRLSGASERISNTRKEYFLDPANRKKVSDAMCKVHNEGRGGAGYTKNYKYSCNGNDYIVQGSYELAFIKWLDMNKMKFRCHEDKIKYIDSKGIERTYLPDFFVEEWNLYVDVKSSYWYSIQKEKFECIYKSNPTLNLKIMLEAELTQLNII